MSDRAEFSATEALNILTPGGKWAVKSALNVAGGAQANLVIPTGYRSITLHPQHDTYVNFDLGNTTAINTANDLILPGGSLYTFPLPYDIGEQGSGNSVAVHVKQVGTSDPSTVRVVLR